jgi:hypothetical protein
MEGRNGRMLTIKLEISPSLKMILLALTCSTYKIPILWSEIERERVACGEGMGAMWQRERGWGGGGEARISLLAPQVGGGSLLFAITSSIDLSIGQESSMISPWEN